jgi:3',5'-nucleoside bisphosphate phosphatase
MHSTYSDGSFTVVELVRAVHAAGLCAFALTDHDTVDGLAEARLEAERLGIELITGVEISTRLDQMEIHVLAYGFDPGHAGLLRMLDARRQARRARLSAMVERLNELGIGLSVEAVKAVAGSGPPGRAHVAKALVAAGHVRDNEEAFRRFLGDGAPAHIRLSTLTPQEAIALTHEAGGRAVWAHPLARPPQRCGGIESVARELKAHGLDGLEEIHPSHATAARRRIRRIAQKLNLKLSGGSDFHGDATPGVSVGVGRGQDEVPASVLEALLR